MRLMRPARRRWTCHWSHVIQRTAEGREVRTRVWICEYPYRTMRSEPCDCDGHQPGADGIRRVHALIGHAV